MFIVFEGSDNSGKTTLMDKVADHFPQYFTTREPGGTELGKSLRELIFKDDISKKAELLMLLADRAEHTKEVLKVQPYILCDRFLPSTLVYQDSFHRKDLLILHEVFCGIHPDIIFLINSDKPHGEKGKDDKFENRDRQQLIDKYKEIAATMKTPIIEIDTTEGDWDSYENYIVKQINYYHENPRKLADNKWEVYPK